MSDHLCITLLHGSEDLSLEENKKSLTMSSNLSTNLCVSITIKQLHTTKACKIVLKYSLTISNTHMLSLSLTHTCSLSLLRTHTRTYKHTHAHTHIQFSFIGCIYVHIFMLLCVYLYCPLYLYVRVLREETY